MGIRVIQELNDDILAAAGRDWLDWRAFDPAKIDPAVASSLQARAAEALHGEFEGAGFPILKDPRMCRVLPFWMPVFSSLGWSVRALTPFRSPLEVAWSLKKRNGFTTKYGCLLWLSHVLDAEEMSRGLERAFLSWDDFLKDRDGSDPSI